MTAPTALTLFQRPIDPAGIVALMAADASKYCRVLFFLAGRSFEHWESALLDLVEVEEAFAAAGLAVEALEPIVETLWARVQFEPDRALRQRKAGAFMSALAMPLDLRQSWLFRWRREEEWRALPAKERALREGRAWIAAWRAGRGAGR